MFGWMIGALELTGLQKCLVVTRIWNVYENKRLERIETVRHAKTR